MSVSVTERAEIYEGLGLCYQMREEYEEAVVNFTDAIAKDSSNV